MLQVSPKNSYNNAPKLKNKGVVRSQLVSGLAALPLQGASFGILALMRKTAKISNKDDFKQLNKAAQKGLRDSGLYKKGVRICKFKELRFPKTFKEFSKLFPMNFQKSDTKALEAIKQEVEAGKFMQILARYDKSADKSISKNIIESTANKQAIQFKLGLNACYAPRANKIIIPNKNMQTSIFHEMGHAMNANGSILLKGLQKCRPLAMLLPTYILLISLLNKRKITDETSRNDSKLQKGADFVKRNAGKLTALSMAPMVLEEGVASLKGQGIAKKLVESGNLSKELFKKVKLTNLCGFSSYALALVASVVTAKLAINVKDKIQEKYEQKKLAKY